MRGRSALMIGMALCLTANAASPAVDDYWHMATVTDLQFAQDVLRSDHPGSAPELGDSDFLDTLERASKVALAAASEARNAADHNSVLAAFMQSFDDPHLAYIPDADNRLRPGRIASPAPNYRVSRLTNLRTVALPKFDTAGGAFIENLARNGDLRSADQIAVDLRGNTGGNSAVGDRLIESIYGSEALRWIQQTMPACPVLWRASRRNVAALGAFARAAPPMQATRVSVATSALESATNSGRSFVQDITPACLRKQKPTRVTRFTQRRITVQIDRFCFSSCLLTVDKFVRLGALLVGEPTARGNWYMEVRRNRLPSGLGAITVVQKVDLRFSRTLGPYLPHRKPAFAGAGAQGEDRGP